MNKRQIKKKNRKEINSLLKSLPFNVHNKRFLNGYYLFEFGESKVCHFQIKELPNFWFGIWLHDNKEEYPFSIFGEHKLMIDKFKPYSSSISCVNLEDFTRDVLRYIDKKDKDIIEYFKDVKYMEDIHKNANDYNSKTLKIVQNYIFEFNNNKDIYPKIHLKLKDYINDNCYNIKFYSYDKDYLETKEFQKHKKEIYLDMCNIIPYSKRYSEDGIGYSEVIGFRIYNSKRMKYLYNPRDYYDKRVLYDKEYQTLEEYFKE